MSFTYRHRKPTSLVALAAFVLASAIPATGAEYNPRLHRLAQGNPNSSGLCVTLDIMHDGASHTTTVSMANEFQYGDGMNFYEFVKSNPIVRRDPTGLMSNGFDYFAEGEQISDNLIAHKIFVLGEINEKARWASLGLQTASNIALSLIPGYGIYEAYQAVGIIRSGRGGLMDYLTAGLGGISHVGYAIKAAKYLTKARLWTARGNRASRFVGNYKSFTRGNYRHNLKVRTGIDPGRKVHAHHVLPKERALDFADRGINVDDPKYLAWWAEHGHLSAHRRGYNTRWDRFFDSDPNAAQIEAFGRDLAREYGLTIGF